MSTYINDSKLSKQKNGKNGTMDAFYYLDGFMSMRILF